MKDGMILFYVKDDEVLPVAMSEEQHQMLQTVLPVIFGNEPIKVLDKPIGEVVDLIKNKWESNPDNNRRDRH